MRFNVDIPIQISDFAAIISAAKTADWCKSVTPMENASFAIQLYDSDDAVILNTEKICSGFLKFSEEYPYLFESIIGKDADDYLEFDKEKLKKWTYAILQMSLFGEIIYE